MSKELKKSKKKDNDVIDFRAVLRQVLYHWPLYLLVFFMSLVASFIYLCYKRAVYSSSASIYISGDKRSSGDAGSLDDFAFFNASKGVENEMEIVKSPLIL